MRDIGDEVGMVSGSLYYYFESKEAILYEILSEALDYLLEAYSAVLHTDDTEEHIGRLFGICVQWIGDHRYAAMVLQNDFANIRDLSSFVPVLKTYEQIRSVWLSVLKRGIREGVLRGDVDIEDAHRVLLGAALSIVHWFDPSGPKTPDDVGHVFRTILLGGMANSPTTSSRSS